jgi:non-ribosomal peptide synthetase-like protein
VREPAVRRVAVSCLLAGTVTAEGYDFLSGAEGAAGIYGRSVLLGGALFAGACVFPVLAKWLLVGRWKETEFPVWSLACLRFWTVKALPRSRPLVLFVGGPLYVLYLRALGARIGAGVTILSRSVPVCTDLLTVGAGTVIRKECHYLGYRARAGRIRTGRVTLGSGVYVGEHTVLDIGTVMGDGSQLGHSSALYEGTPGGRTVPAGGRRHGSPAQPTDVDHVRVPPARCSTARRFGYGLAGLLQALLLWVPLGVGGLRLLFTRVPGPDALVAPDSRNRR